MKNMLRDRKFRYGLYASLITFAVIGIIVLINILLSFSRISVRKDITQNKVHEISDQTKQVLANLDKSGKVLNVYLFTKEDYYNYLDLKQKETIERLLREYEKISKNFKLNLISIEKNPGLADKYKIELGFETAFDINGKSKVISLRDMYEGMNFNPEQAFTSGIINVMNEKPKVIYFIQGHKELSLDKELTYLKRGIEREGYIIKTLNIGKEGQIPEDASLVIDIGAKNDFAQSEIDILKGYLDKGGKGIFLVRWYYDEPQITALNNLFKNYGIQIENNIVIDPSSYFKIAQDMIIPQYQDNIIVNKLKEIPEYYMVVPNARSIELLEDSQGATVESVLKSTNNSWGESSLEQYKSKNITFDNNDKKGPLTLAAYITKIISENNHMQIMVVGNDLIVSNNVIDVTQSWANMDFMLNAVGQLTNTQQSVTIRAKPLDFKPMTIPQNSAKTIFWLLILIIPLVVILTGIVVWLMRINR